MGSVRAISNKIVEHRIDRCRHRAGFGEAGEDLRGCHGAGQDGRRSRQHRCRQQGKGVEDHGKDRSDEDREKLLIAVSGAVTDMYRYFAPQRQRNASIAANSAALHKEQKLGRNDPCYCGSGKKYKKCCGTLPIN